MNCTFSNLQPVGDNKGDFEAISSSHLVRSRSKLISSRDLGEMTSDEGISEETTWTRVSMFTSSDDDSGLSCDRLGLQLQRYLGAADGWILAPLRRSRTAPHP